MARIKDLESTVLVKAIDNNAKTAMDYYVMCTFEDFGLKFPSHDASKVLTSVCRILNIKK